MGVYVSAKKEGGKTDDVGRGEAQGIDVIAM